jgi:hypothetical protein
VRLDCHGIHEAERRSIADEQASGAGDTVAEQAGQ